MYKVDTKEINELPLKSLLTLQERLDDAIKAATVRERAEVKLEMEQLAKRRGFDLADVLHRKSAKKYGKSAKFINPEDKSQTWTGHGRKPNWLVDAMKKGAQLDEYRV